MTPQDSQHAFADSAPVAGLNTLSRERQPSHDLWGGISARLAAVPATQRRQQSSLWPYALAASVCLAVLTGVLLHQPLASQPPAAIALVTTTRMATERVASSHEFDHHPYSNRDGQAATALLSLRTLRMLRSESLDNAPSLVAERADGSGLMKATYSAGTSHGGHNAHGQQAILRANLKLVVQAEREVRRALKTDPDSASLQSLLNVAQEKRTVLTSLLIHAQD